MSDRLQGRPRALPSTPDNLAPPSVTSLGAWRYRCDREATLEAYARAYRGNSSQCTCVGCRNFVLARPLVFVPAFLSVLATMGIDPEKDGEVYHNGRLAPGKHHYGGWFHFVGMLDEAGDFAPVKCGDDLAIILCQKSAPCLPELKEFPLVQLEFVASAVPWLLDEPEAP
jgi:hypothetical protein